MSETGSDFGAPDEPTPQDGGAARLHEARVARVPADARPVPSPDLTLAGAGAPAEVHFRAASTTRAEKLLKITAAIADAVSSEQVFEAVVDHVADAVGASSAALWVLSPERATARLARALGYSDVARRQLSELRPYTGERIPVVDAIRTGHPVWIDSQADLLQRYPHLRAITTPGRIYRVSALPLLAHGQVVGVLGLTIEGASAGPDEERDFLLLIARYASQAVERLRLFEAERSSRAAANAAASRAEQLYRFAQAVVAADSVDSVYDAALSAIERALAARRSAILTYDAEGVMRFRAWRNLTDHYRSAVEGHSPWPRDATAPQPVLVPDPETDPAMAPYLPLFRREGIGALAFIPLVNGGRLLGKFMVYYDRPHVFPSQDVEMARAIANHLGSVITRFAVVAKLEETIRHNELFAGVLAHDLRNPLGAMMTAAQMMLTRGEGLEMRPDRTARFVGRILSSGQRMMGMIDQLLDFTRARSGGGIRVEPREADLAELCAQACDELELGHPEWTITREVRGDLRGRWDPDRLLQVLSNLIGNAGQHGAAGAPIAVTLDGRDAELVILDVHNQGTVPESLVAHLFDPFRSAGQRRRDHTGGLGLGLFIVRELVRAHNGTVGMSSNQATGTTFTVRLPRHPPAGSGAAGPAAAADNTSAGAESRP